MPMSPALDRSRAEDDAACRWMMTGPGFPRLFVRSWRIWRYAAFGAALATIGGPARAFEDEAGRRTAFMIPAQPLAEALSAFGEATRIPMFIDGELVRGRRSTEVSGLHTSADALRDLLAGTGLVAHSIEGKGFTLTAVSPPSGSGDGADRMSGPGVERYAAAIQLALHEVLCRHRETRPGTYRSLIRLWIDATGGVTRSDVLTSTGDPRRDLLLAAELRSLAIGEPPPAGLRQPVTLLLRPSPASSLDYCLLARVGDGDD